MSNAAISALEDRYAIPTYAKWPVAFVRGSGCTLWDADGREYLDLYGGHCTSVLGHAHPRWVTAVSEQAARLGFYSNVAASDVRARFLEHLIAFAPAHLERAFLCNSGAEAIEGAIKLARKWGKEKRDGAHEVICTDNAFHGRTLATLTAGGSEKYKLPYLPLPPGFVHVPFDDVEAIREATSDKTCAVLVEPIQGEGGVNVPRDDYLRRLRAWCDEAGVLLILGEIQTGIGRTGSLFACEQAGITPDFLCLSKGLTGGFLPLSVVLTGEAVYEAFYDDYSTLRAFLHSHSYTGNPLACAAALATLDIFESDRVIERNVALARHMARAADRFRDHTNVAEVRQTGMILAIELVRDRRTRESFDWRERRGLRLYEHALSRGVLLRPLGPVVYWMPPYVIGEDEVALLAEVTAEGIDLACA